MFLLSVLLAGAQTSTAFPVEAEAKKVVTEYAKHVFEELTRRGLEAQFDSLKGYVARNPNEMQKPAAQLAQRLKACKAGSEDPICNLLRPHP
jgi:hypothetical protein